MRGGSVLFALDAGSGSTAEVRLVLRGLHRHVLQFSDAPRRAAVRLPPGAFFGAWQASFPEFAPNAVVAYATPSGDRLAAVT